MTIPDNLVLDVSVEKSSWRKILPEYNELILLSLKQVFDYVEEARTTYRFTQLELSIVLCNDELIHKLNREYRNQDKPTNVLSFQGLDDDEIERYFYSEEAVPEYPHSLGELFVSDETMIKEVQQGGVSLKDHFIHIIIHGVLHLFGYDHIDDEDAEIMEGIETKLLRNLNIDDPYRA